jgi:hypothetical protein
VLASKLSKPIGKQYSGLLAVLETHHGSFVIARKQLRCQPWDRRGAEAGALLA